MPEKVSSPSMKAELVRLCISQSRPVISAQMPMLEKAAAIHNRRYSRYLKAASTWGRLGEAPHLWSSMGGDAIS